MLFFKRLKMDARATLIIAIALLTASCSEDPNEAANKMFVEVQRQVSGVKGLQKEKALEELRAATKMLNQIVDRYPSSDVAVKIISGQSIGKISLDSLAQYADEIEFKNLKLFRRCARRGNKLDKCMCMAKFIKNRFSSDHWNLVISDMKNISNDMGKTLNEKFKILIPGILRKCGEMNLPG